MSRNRATEINEALYDEFWRACPDFLRYNPGAVHRRRGILRLLHEIGPFDSLLDVGCGTGELLLLLRSQFPKVKFSGVDLSSTTIEDARVRLPFAELDVLNLEEGPLDRKFDVVVCTEVIEHLARPTDAVRSLAAMVAPGGHLVLTCPTGKVHATERHWGHVAHPRPEGLRRMLEDAGLEIRMLQNWGFPFYLALKYATNVRPDWAIRNFASGAYTPRAKAISKFLYWVNYGNLPSSRLGVQLFALARRPA